LVRLPKAGQVLNRYPDQIDGDLLKGVLSSITYPTGGKTGFSYELNDYSNLKGDDQYTLQPQSCTRQFNDIGLHRNL